MMDTVEPHPSNFEDGRDAVVTPPQQASRPGARVLSSVFVFFAAATYILMVFVGPAVRAVPGAAARAALPSLRKPLVPRLPAFPPMPAPDAIPSMPRSGPPTQREFPSGPGPFSTNNLFASPTSFSGLRDVRTMHTAAASADQDAPAFESKGKRFRLTAVPVIFNYRGEVLRMWNAATGSAGHWTFPHGGMLQGEDVATAAARECLDQIGLEATRLEFMGVVPEARECESCVEPYHPERITKAEDVESRTYASKKVTDAGYDGELMLYALFRYTGTDLALGDTPFSASAIHDGLSKPHVTTSGLSVLRWSPFTEKAPEGTLAAEKGAYEYLFQKSSGMVKAWPKIQPPPRPEDAEDYDPYRAHTFRAPAMAAGYVAGDQPGVRVPAFRPEARPFTKPNLKRYRQSIVPVVLNDRGEVLRMWTAARGSGGHWQYPMGPVLHGEEMAAAAFRELLEEVDFPSDDLEFLETLPILWSATIDRPSEVDWSNVKHATDVEDITYQRRAVQELGLDGEMPIFVILRYRTPTWAKLAPVEIPFTSNMLHRGEDRKISGKSSHLRWVPFERFPEGTLETEKGALKYLFSASAKHVMNFLEE